MNIPVKFYTDVTGKTVGDIIKIAGKRGYLELVAIDNILWRSCNEQDQTTTDN